MKNAYFLQKNPFIIPTNDGKLIEEHIGRVINDENDISIAHMVAPPGWSEPFQNPEFDEYTLIIRGRKQIEIEDEKIYLEKGHSILIRKGSRVRYSNPFEEELE